MQIEKEDVRSQCRSCEAKINHNDDSIENMGTRITGLCPTCYGVAMEEAYKALQDIVPPELLDFGRALRK